MIAIIFGPFYNQDCSHIWTSTEPRLQSYMDPIKTKIAVIFGPQHVRYCTHNWTPYILTPANINFDEFHKKLHSIFQNWLIHHEWHWLLTSSITDICITDSVKRIFECSILVIFVNFISLTWIWVDSDSNNYKLSVSK